jgi:hypothetical protein
MVDNVFLVLLPCHNKVVRNGMENLAKNLGLRSFSLKMKNLWDAHIMNRPGIPNLIPKFVANRVGKVVWAKLWHLRW